MLFCICRLIWFSSPGYKVVELFRRKIVCPEGSNECFSLYDSDKTSMQWLHVFRQPLFIQNDVVLGIKLQSSNPRNYLKYNERRGNVDAVE